MGFIRRRRLSVFGHIARLTQSGDSSRQRPTLPRRPIIRSFTWWGLETSSWSSSRSLDRPTPNDTGSVPANLWRQTGHSTGPWRCDASQSHATARAGYAMTTTTIATMGAQPQAFVIGSRCRVPDAPTLILLPTQVRPRPNAASPVITTYRTRYRLNDGNNLSRNY